MTPGRREAGRRFHPESRTQNSRCSGRRDPERLQERVDLGEKCRQKCENAGGR